jgi:LytR_cpsA_psr family
MSGRRRKTDAGGGHRAPPELDIVDALDQEAQVATLVGADEADIGQHGASLRSARRAARRAERDKRHRYTQLGAAAAGVVVLLVLAVLGIRALTDDDGGTTTGSTTSSDIATRTSVLVTLTGVEETAEAAVLVGWDAGLTKGGAFTVPAGVLVDVEGLGQLPLADAVPDGGGEASARAFATAAGAEVAGSWSLDESALSALVEEVGGITVEVDVDVTEPGTDGATVVIPAGNSALDGAKAAAYASFRAEGEDTVAQAQRFGRVLQGALAALPQGEEAVGAILVGLGGGSITTLDDATLARTLSDLGQATEAGQSPWQPLPTTAGPAPGTLLVDAAVLGPLLVETGLTG